MWLATRIEIEIRPVVRLDNPCVRYPAMTPALEATCSCLLGVALTDDVISGACQIFVCSRVCEQVNSNALCSASVLTNGFCKHRCLVKQMSK